MDSLKKKMGNELDGQSLGLPYFQLSLLAWAPVLKVKKAIELEIEITSPLLEEKELDDRPLL